MRPQTWTTAPRRFVALLLLSLLATACAATPTITAAAEGGDDAPTAPPSTSSSIEEVEVASAMHVETNGDIPESSEAFLADLDWSNYKVIASRASVVPQGAGLARAAAPADPTTRAGPVDGYTTFTHSSGRISVDVPDGWESREIEGSSEYELFVSGDVRRYLAGAPIDGVRLRLFETGELTPFLGTVELVEIGRACVEVAHGNDVVGPTIATMRQYVCPDRGIVVRGTYSEQLGAGLLLELTYDAAPSAEADSAQVNTILDSITWQ